MIPRQAQYLLRFDDLYPTVSRSRWERFLPLLEEFRLCPILAVVPDNRDRDLERAEPDPGFWAEMRAMEDAGAAIALHGYRHLCRSKGKSLVPLHSRSEFAGVDPDSQREWIESGLDILRGHGLDPRVWVAPRHGFDRNTLRALRNERIALLSDGLARVPFMRGGLTWIPQQLWAPVEKPGGLWTICIHPNTARDSLVDQLRDFLRRHAAQFTSVDRVVEELKPAKLGKAERMHEILALWKIRVSRARKRALAKTSS
jgi:peptidoglycan/xylan/chitin deacetylase (PgdA/CDA1 family)